MYTHPHPTTHPLPCTHTHTHTLKHTLVKVYLLFVFAWLFSGSVFRFEYCSTINSET